jgi:hypothetical protein
MIWAAPSFSKKNLGPPRLARLRFASSISLVRVDICRLTCALSFSVPLCFGMRPENSRNFSSFSWGVRACEASYHFFLATTGRFVGIDGALYEKENKWR